MVKEVFLTEKGLQEKKDELEYLRTVTRNEVADKIRVARGFGDLSENAEYDQAKLEQAQVEERIAKLEDMIRNVTMSAGVTSHRTYGSRKCPTFSSARNTTGVRYFSERLKARITTQIGRASCRERV